MNGGPLTVFISYSHADEELCQEFQTHLSQLQHDGLIESWHDRKITGGEEWKGKIDEKLNSAQIILLLISPDFLASQYCYDIEMARGLERHQAGEARVIPIILRPSDWRTSPFAKLQAFPKNGKPIVDWETHDHGFLDAVKSLRAVVGEMKGQIRQQGSAPGAPPAKPFPWKKLGAAIVLVALLAAGGWWVLKRQQQRRAEERQYVAQGDAFLDVGRYSEAREPYQQALRLNTSNAPAKLGLEKVGLAALRSDPVAFKQRLDQMLRETPRDSHLRVFEGDYLHGLGQTKEAMKCYEEAKKLNPQLAEAYFRLGVLYSQQQNSGQALQMYLRAVELSPSSPHYRNNLGNQYFMRGDYEIAVEEYGKLDRFPLAALESGKILRLLGRFDEAREQEEVAITWLKEDATWNLPENQWPWYFEVSGSQGVRLTGRAEKLCFAHFSLSATLFLQGDQDKAEEQLRHAAEACGPRSLDIKSVVRSEVERVAEDRGELAARVAAYKTRLSRP